jgi:hypothetical protein
VWVFEDATQLRAPELIKKAFSLFQFVHASNIYDTQDDSEERCMQVSLKKSRKKFLLAAETSEQKTSPSTCH